MDPIFKLMTGPTLLLVMAIIICVEAIFMVESFTTILEITIDLGGSPWNAMKLVLLKAPEIVDFGLPIALLIGVYFSLTRIREEGAFVILAAAGISWVRIPVFALITGFAVGAISILVSGFIAPQAQHIQRLALFDMQASQIVKQLNNKSPRQTVQQFAGTVFIATSQSPTDNGLMVYHNTDDGNWHISLAENWGITGPDGDGNYLVELSNFRDYEGNLKPYDLTFREFDKQSGKTVEAAPLELPRFSTLTINNTSVQFRLEEILGEKDVFRRGNEQFLPELISGAGEGNSNDELRMLAEKIARAILNPFAALIALLACTVATRSFWRFTALPFAVTALLALDVLGRLFMVWTTEIGQVGVLLGAGAMVLGTTLPLLVLLGRTGEGIIHPFRDKTG